MLCTGMQKPVRTRKTMIRVQNRHTSVLGCQQSILVGNVTKVACRWFQVQEKKNLDSRRNSHKAMMMTATKDTSLWLILVIPNICRRYTVISRSCLKEWRLTKCQKLLCNIYDQKNYVVHITPLKLALDYGLMLKKVHRMKEFKQEAYLKSYIDMKKELRTRPKMFLKSLFQVNE